MKEKITRIIKGVVVITEEVIEVITEEVIEIKVIGGTTIRKITIETIEIIIIDKKTQPRPKRTPKPSASNSTRVAHHASKTARSRARSKKVIKKRT